MAGRKHHHIPQLLQRGFGEKNRKSVQVWVYSREKPPFQTSTGNFGAERDFYFEGEDKLVDNLITEFEGDIQGFIQDLRIGSIDALEDRSTISSVLSHLEMRSKFLREEMLFLSNAIFGALQRFLSKPEYFYSLLKSAKAENPDIISDALDKAGLDPEQRPLAELWIEENLDQYIEKNALQFSHELKPALSYLVNKLGEMVKSAHLSALRKYVGEIGRRKAYLSLTYCIEHLKNREILMPDTMVAFIKRNGSATPFMDKTDTVEEVYLPLASNTILYGYRGRPENRDILTINKILASCAAKNFVAHEENEYFQKLAPRIGRNAKMISSAEIRKIIREVLDVKK